MSEDPKKKKPAPKPKSTYTPTSFAELRAMQNPPPAKIRPEALSRDFSGSITQAEYNKKAEISRKAGSPTIHTAPSPASDQWAKGGRLPGGGSKGRRGSGGALTPLAPYQPLPFPKLIPKGQYGTDPATYGLRNNMNDGLMKMHKKNNDIQRQKYNRLMMTPQGKYRRQLWDMKMAEVGLNPQGNPLGGLRSIMIQRMNQLRGGR